MKLLSLALPALLSCGVSLAQQDPDEIPESAIKIDPTALNENSPAMQAMMAQQSVLAALAAKVRPSVVTVRAYTRISGDVKAPEANGWVDGEVSDYPGFFEHAACSGWVTRADGEVLTVNSGLLKEDGSGPDLIDIETHDYQRVIVERVGIEPTVNVAILQAMVFPNGHSRKLQPLEFGDSTQIAPGHWCVGFGDPSGPERFMSLGTFISRPSRDCYQDLLSAFYGQVGMVAHPQAYGGPLVDLRGKVIGVLAPRQIAPGRWQVSERMGTELILPSKILRGLYESIRKVRSFKSPFLGIAVMSRPEIAKVHGIEAYEKMDKPRNGIMIENVFDPSDALTSGIRPGDFLVTFDKTRIFTPVDFQRKMYLDGIGAKVRLEVYRDGKTHWHELSIVERPDAARPR